LKRFTETNKWRMPWFRRLSPAAKLFYQYSEDNCDNAGVIDPDFELATFQIGQPIKEDVIAEFGDRMQRLPNGKFWLTEFIREQFGEMTGTTNLQKSAIKLIIFHGLKYPIPSSENRQALPKPSHSPPIALPKPVSKGKGKGKGKGNQSMYLIDQTTRARARLVDVKKNSTFIALKLTNRILSNNPPWHYDNCKVELARLKSRSLQTIIEPFAGKLSENQILLYWTAAVRLAHSAKVDRLARDATPYAVECFKQQLQQQKGP